MRFVLYTNALSAHQIPLAREIAKLVSEDNFRYIYTSKDGQKLQESNATDGWIEYLPIEQTNEWLEDADVMLVGGIRPIGLCERRAASGKTTFYMSERWFKPPIGILRLLHPKYFRMAWRIVRLIKNSDSFTYLPIGIHAARDMARLCGLFSGDLRCLFRAPELDFESKPGGRIFFSSPSLHLPATPTAKSPLQRPTTTTTKYCLDKMRMWGYFVAPSKFPHLNSHFQTQNSKLKMLRVLWVGRMLGWKRVDTIIKACKRLANAELDLYGSGPEEQKLRKLAEGYTTRIRFHSPVAIAEVRNLMRSHDVYVLSSNAYEGWGAVVSEALEESMKVIGTYEAGSSATILPCDCLFHTGDWKFLSQKLIEAECVTIGDWTAEYAATGLISTVS